jgi:hypothetical protein
VSSYRHFFYPCSLRLIVQDITLLSISVYSMEQSSRIEEFGGI